MTQGKGCYYPQHKAQEFISDLNIPLISPLAKFIGLGHKRHHVKKYHGAGLHYNKR